MQSKVGEGVCPFKCRAMILQGEQFHIIWNDMYECGIIVAVAYVNTEEEAVPATPQMYTPKGTQITL
jgi:hypothetical protein